MKKKNSSMIKFLIVTATALVVSSLPEIQPLIWLAGY